MFRCLIQDTMKDGIDHNSATIRRWENRLVKRTLHQCLPARCVTCLAYRSILERSRRILRDLSKNGY